MEALLVNGTSNETHHGMWLTAPTPRGEGEANPVGDSCQKVIPARCELHVTGDEDMASVRTRSALRRKLSLSLNCWHWHCRVRQRAISRRSQTDTLAFVRTESSPTPRKWWLNPAALRDASSKRTPGEQREIRLEAIGGKLFKSGYLRCELLVSLGPPLGYMKNQK